jgi:hypothetical protein
VSGPPVLVGTVTVIVFPALNKPPLVNVNWYNCCGSVFEPDSKNNWYAVRSEIEGATPESIQVTVKAAPPGTDAPAAGTVNSTSANARGQKAARR